MRFQEHCTQCRRKCQRVQSGDTDCNGHGQTELTVEYTGCSRHERNGDEHEHHHEGDRDDGAADLVHGVNRCLARALVTDVKFGMYRLDHHNRVIDHNRDGEHQCGECDEVDGEADQAHAEECTDQGDWNCDGRDDG